jgi:hypothetical protein
MYLPAWVVAVTSFLRATSDLQAPLDMRPAPTRVDNYDKIWRFVAGQYTGNSSCLGVSEAKAGAHVKLVAMESAETATAWTLSRASPHGYSSAITIRVNATDLCITAQTKKGESDGDWDEGVDGPLTLAKCPPPEPEEGWENPPVAGLWRIRDLYPFRTVNIGLAFDAQYIHYEVNNASVEARSGYDDEWTGDFMAFPDKL